jgi:hypothetical protein
MADRVFFVPAGSELFGHSILPPEMINDLRRIAEIPDETIELVVQRLQAYEGLLNTSRLGQLLGSMLRDEPMAAAATAALQNLQSDQVSPTLQSLRRWQKTNEQNIEKFPNVALDALERKLPRLIQKYPAIDRYRKGAWLSSAIGNTATSVQVICDVRPVFDDRREVVQAVVPLTVLKIVYDRQDEETRSLDVYLSDAMLDELADKVQKAQQKQKVLRESVKTWIPHGLVNLSE